MNEKILTIAPFTVEEQIHHYRYALQSLKHRTFYTENRFYILSKLHESAKSRTICIPDFISTDFQKIIIDTPIHDKLPSHINKELTQAIHGNYKKRKYIIEKLIKTYSENRELVIKALEAEFPDSDLEQIRVSLRLFGAKGSYYLPKVEHSFDKSKMHLFLRYDSSWENVLRMAILAIVHNRRFIPKVENTYSEWKKKQNTAEDIARKYIRDRSFPEILNKSTVGKLAKESMNYLKRLGIELSLEKRLFHNNIFTNIEQKLIEVLQDKKGEVVHFKELFNQIWPDKAPEDYSLYAMTKLVERTREKIRQAGISAQHIHTERGKGYIWT